MDSGVFHFCFNRIVKEYGVWTAKRVGICPFGQAGMEAKKILNQAYGVQEEFIIDNGLAKYNSKILAIEDLECMDTEDVIIFLTAMNEKVNQEIEYKLRGLNKNLTILNILDPIIYNADDKKYFFAKLKELMSVKKVKDKELIRVGCAHDGGYIMADSIYRGMHVAYSFGIADNVSWDEDIANMGIEVYMYDMTIPESPKQNAKFHFNKMGIAGKDIPEKNLYSMKTILDKNNDFSNKNLILKMDVEGAEWDFINKTEIEILDNFEQITFELHGLTNTENKEIIFKALSKLNVTHQVVWIHGNNFGKAEKAGEIIIPDCLEITYLNRQKYEFETYKKIVFPLPKLDASNIPGMKDFNLGNWGM